MPSKNSVQFNPGNFYHVYNRGNNRENIFYTDENYSYFLRKFDEYLSGYLDVFAYCLLPNHFHFLARVREMEKDLAGLQNLQGLSPTNRNPVSQAFSNFLNAYSKALNKQQNRTGSLFQRNLKRRLIDDQGYLIRIIYYIHLNPVHHRMRRQFEDYPWSSYHCFLAQRPTILRRNEVLSWFGGKDEFIGYHKSALAHLQELESYLIEDD